MLYTYTFILYYLSILFTFLSHGYWGLSSVFEPTCWYYTTNSVLGYFLFSQNLNLTSHECEKYIFVLWRKQNGNYVTLIMLLICFISVLQYLCIFCWSTLCSFFVKPQKIDNEYRHKYNRVSVPPSPHVPIFFCI